jgi:hypothetical protein
MNMWNKAAYSVETPSIFFFHNPKAGGTSLRHLLERPFRAQQICPDIEDGPIVHETVAGQFAALDGYKLYRGHYGRDIYACVSSRAETLLTASNFRHPVSRIVSLYNYFRNMVQVDEQTLCEPRYAAVQLAKRLDFARFIASEDPIVQLYIENFHYRQLTHSGWRPAISGDLDEACDFIDHMAWCYVCEFPDLSLRWAREAFGLEVQGMPIYNRTAAKDQTITALDVDRRTYRAICDRNGLDLAIYRHAIDRLFARQ